MGQYCLVVPEHDLILAMTAAATDMQAPLDAVWDSLLPGIDSAGSPQDDQLLAERMRRLSLPLETGNSSLRPSATAVVDASTEPSALPHRTSVVIDPVGGGWRVRLDTGETLVDVDVGDGTWRESAPLGRPIVAAGAWQGATFVADLYVITSPSRVRLIVDPPRAVANWNIVPLTGSDLLRQLRSPLMTRPDVA